MLLTVPAQLTTVSEVRRTNDQWAGCRRVGPVLLAGIVAVAGSDCTASSVALKQPVPERDKSERPSCSESERISSRRAR